MSCSIKQKHVKYQFNRREEIRQSEFVIQSFQMILIT